MSPKRPIRPDHQPSLFAEELRVPESVGGVVPSEPEGVVAEVATGGRAKSASYVSWQELDRIIRGVYAQYDRLKNETRCKTRRG